MIHLSRYQCIHCLNYSAINMPYHCECNQKETTATGSDDRYFACHYHVNRLPRLHHRIVAKLSQRPPCIPIGVKCCYRVADLAQVATFVVVDWVSCLASIESMFAHMANIEHEDFRMRLNELMIIQYSYVLCEANSRLCLCL